MSISRVATPPRKMQTPIRRREVLRMATDPSTMAIWKADPARSKLGPWREARSRFSSWSRAMAVSSFLPSPLSGLVGSLRSGSLS